ncbi:prohormone-2-like [Trichogramma pretiosum]|uniref:prohormone-2-like n=1 Tax=Trichogramma pretiosum TaxID=7493 RepID=UPI0006C9A296|nr:prohormone-2-like [Trichogramma pretiosum]
MMTDWIRLLAICAVFVFAVQAQPTGLNDPSKKDEETTKPAGTLSNSGLDDVASTRVENEHDTQQKKENQQQEQQQQQMLQQQLQQQEQLEAAQPKALPSSLLLDQLVRSNAPQHGKNYDQLSYYQDPRYKRELDIDPEELIAFLSLYDNDPRNRGNWRYSNEEYDVDDDSALMGMSGDDPRGNNWPDAELGYPLQQVIRNRYEPLSASELARSRYYTDKYMPSGLDAQQQQQQPYNNDAAALPEYGTPQYGVAYGSVSPHRNAYYQPEKRFMVARKRSQNYDGYGNAHNGLMYNSHNYPGYQHRLFY